MIKSYLFRFSFGFLLIILCATVHQYVFAQSAKDVYKDLRKIEMKIEMGTSFRDYIVDLTDVRLEMEFLVDSPHAKENPPLIVHLQKTIEYYKKAGIVWKTIIDGANQYGLVKMSRETAKKLSRFLPSISDDLEAEIKSTTPVVMIERTEIEPFLKSLWKNASEELMLIRKVLQK